ncbi:MAG: methyltransferase [Deltaproteobacteria bacterium]|nr:methyltransferase [Deltaproteobacteria bacterium]
MTARRPADFSLAHAVRSDSFTPRRSDLEPLLNLLAQDESLEGPIERAISRVGPESVPAVRARLREATPPFKGRLARLLGRLAVTDPSLRADLAGLLVDSDPKTRRNAIIALGKVPSSLGGAGPPVDVEAALIAAWGRETREDLRRSIADALGKIGGATALELLKRFEPRTPETPGLAEVVGRATTKLHRSLLRASRSRIDPERAPPSPVPIVFHCRSGLAPILADELPPGFRARVDGPDRVLAVLTGPLSEVFRARTMLRFGFPLPAERGETGNALVRALTSEAAGRVFETWTDGAIRYGIRWVGGGHQRALAWSTAQRVAEKRPTFVNDPTRSTWDAVVEEANGEVRVELVPKALDDPRFDYRLGQVAAASHPTIAAALARIAGARPDDVVWDPFVGSGLELVERARLGRSRALHGTDRDPKAIGVARRNLAAAGIHGARLAVADAGEHEVPGVTLIITNPPMGRRIDRGDVGPLLDRFIDHAGRSLVDGGRLVWVSPLPRRTIARARRVGLVLASTRDIDMGGFTAQIQVFCKAKQPATKPRS